MIGGQQRNWGPTAVLQVEGVAVLVVTNAAQMWDQQQFKAFGIDPQAHRVVALKSAQHFRAAFEPSAGEVIVCDSGALCGPDCTDHALPQGAAAGVPAGRRYRYRAVARAAPLIGGRPSWRRKSFTTRGRQIAHLDYCRGERRLANRIICSRRVKARGRAICRRQRGSGQGFVHGRLSPLGAAGRAAWSVPHPLCSWA
jgi:hypothetical protein